MIELDDGTSVNVRQSALKAEDSGRAENEISGDTEEAELGMQAARDE